MKENAADGGVSSMAINTNKKSGRFLGLAFLIVMSSNTSAIAKNVGEDIFDSQCKSCHQLPEKAPDTLKKIWESKGPNLSSAGIKYKPEWMKKWLQNPTRIRPTGMFYGNHIKTGKKRDEIDTASLVKHPQLSSEQSAQVVELLVTQKQNQNLVNAGEYKSGTIPMMMGEMMFDKFKGCLACHQIEPGFGGLSGSEMYTAANRLQEDYLISFMRNPQAWEPKSMMPNKNLKDSDLQKLVHYLRALSKEKFK